MPSVTDTIAPTLRASVASVKPSIRCLIRSLISVALMAMSFDPLKPVLCRKLERHALEPGAQRSVDDEVTGTNDGATNQGSVHFVVQPHLALQSARQCGGQRFLLFGIQSSCSRDGDVNYAVGLIFQRIKQRRDFGQIDEPSVLSKSEHELVPLGPQFATADIDHEVGERFRRDARIAKESRDARIP